MILQSSHALTNKMKTEYALLKDLAHLTAPQSPHFQIMKHAPNSLTQMLDSSNSSDPKETPPRQPQLSWLKLDQNAFIKRIKQEMPASFLHLLLKEDQTLKIVKLQLSCQTMSTVNIHALTKYELFDIKVRYPCKSLNI